MNDEKGLVDEVYYMIHDGKMTIFYKSRQPKIITDHDKIETVKVLADSYIDSKDKDERDFLLELINEIIL